MDFVVANSMNPSSLITVKYKNKGASEILGLSKYKYIVLIM